jgi:hypothetical protein
MFIALRAKLLYEQFPKTFSKIFKEGFSRAKRVLLQREGLIINPDSWRRTGMQIFEK